MLGMDFLGPISPTCESGAKYILVVVDYFSRFVWAQACERTTEEAVIAVFEKTLTPVFGWPANVYSDNGPHFTGLRLLEVFETHGTHHCFAPVYHPRSAQT